MQRKKIIPKDTIKGKFEYMEDEEQSSHFDKYQIRVGDTLVAFLYMPQKYHLLPVSIYLKQELQVETAY